MNDDQSSEFRMQLGSLLMQMTWSHRQVTLHINVFREDSHYFSDRIHHHNINEQEASTSMKFQYPKAAGHLFLTRDQHSKSCLDHYSKSSRYTGYLMSYILWLRIQQHTPRNTVTIDTPKLVQSVLVHGVHRVHMCTH